MRQHIVLSNYTSLFPWLQCFPKQPLSHALISCECQYAFLGKQSVNHLSTSLNLSRTNELHRNYYTYGFFGGGGVGVGVGHPYLI